MQGILLAQSNGGWDNDLQGNHHGSGNTGPCQQHQIPMKGRGTVVRCMTVMTAVATAATVRQPFDVPMWYVRLRVAFTG